MDEKRMEKERKIIVGMLDVNAASDNPMKSRQSAAFAAYLLMGTARHLASENVLDAGGVSHATLKKWANEHEWEKAAARFDELMAQESPADGEGPGPSTQPEPPSATVVCALCAAEFPRPAETTDESEIQCPTCGGRFVPRYGAFLYEQSPLKTGESDADVPGRNIRLVRIHRPLGVALDEDGRQQVGTELTQAVYKVEAFRKEIEEIKQEAREEVKSRESEIDALLNREKALADAWHNGTKTEDVECIDVRDYENGKLLSFRMDSGALVNVRDLTGDEQQVRMSFKDGGGEVVTTGGTAAAENQCPLMTLAEDGTKRCAAMDGEECDLEPKLKYTVCQIKAEHDEENPEPSEAGGDNDHSDAACDEEPEE